jgi:guanylate kinase
MKKAIIVAGPSGSGKGTLCRFLLAVFPILMLSISATTRKMRGNEAEGKDYFYFLLEAFKAKIEEKYFLEYEEVYPGKWYGTIKSFVEEIWQEDKIALFDVDVAGARRLMKKLGKENVLSIFVEPTSLETLRERLLARGTETIEQIDIRLAKAPEEIAQKIYFDRVIINDNLDTAKAEIMKMTEDFLGISALKELTAQNA